MMISLAVAVAAAECVVVASVLSTWDESLLVLSPLDLYMIWLPFIIAA